MVVVGRRGDRQHLADRLDPIRFPMIVDERDHGFLGGRAPPGQNTLTPCEESRSPVEAPGSRAPGPSTSPPCPSERQPACRCQPPPSSPSREVSAGCSRSWPRSTRSPSNVIGARPPDRGPAAPRATGLQAKTCCLSACSWLHLLRVGASGKPGAVHIDKCEVPN